MRSKAGRGVTGSRGHNGLIRNHRA